MPNSINCHKTMSNSLKAVVKSTIFREYIGVKPLPKLDHFPADIINSDIHEFHFLLGIATEDYVDGQGTGHFKRSWDYEYFSPERVRILKEKFKNVKVIISIGGHGTDQPFNPAEKTLWITKAFDSIKEIIQDYQIKDPCHCHDFNIDGIDINYDHIKSSEDDFSSCIGDLINQLKNDPDLSINVVSIAPTDLVRPHYHRLYWDNEDIINWVDYQFYNQTVSSKEEFVKLYHELVNQYSVDKILPGVSTDPHDASKMPREVFIDGIKELHGTKLLPGAFVWNANNSKIPPNPDLKPFFLERIIQTILTSP